MPDPSSPSSQSDEMEDEKGTRDRSERHRAVPGELEQETAAPAEMEAVCSGTDQQREWETEPAQAEPSPAADGEQESDELTLEEAMNVIADVGSCRGKTLAQIADRRPTTLRWYFTTCPDSSERLKKAARMVFESLNLQRSA